MTGVATAGALRLERLFSTPPPGDTETRGGELPADLAWGYEGRLAIALRRDRPTVVANFVTTLDGVVAFETDWTSGGGEVSGFYKPDRFMMGLLRGLADVVLVGAGTVRAAPKHEWTPRHVYRSSADAFAAWRHHLGLAEQPTTIVVTASGDLDTNHPGLSAPDVPVRVVTTQAGARRLADRPARDGLTIEVASGKAVAGRDVIAAAAGVGGRLVLCEGGPHLFGDLLDEGLVDELFLTVAPQVAGRDERKPRLALVEGLAFGVEAAPWATLLSAHRSADHLFLRYALRPRPPGPDATEPEGHPGEDGRRPVDAR